MRSRGRGFGAVALVALAGATGCSTSDSGEDRTPGYQMVKEWVCCVPRDGVVAPGGWCECAARRDGLAVDCSEQIVNACPTTPHCVVQGAGEDWSCACSDDGGELPTGTDVYPVEQCPP